MRAAIIALGVAGTSLPQAALGQAGPGRADTAAFHTVARLLAEGAPAGRGVLTAAGALAAGPAASYAVAGAEGGVAGTFLASGLDVFKSRIRLPRGAGIALTAYDVLDGGVSLRRTAAGLIEAQAMGAVYSGTQAAALWLAASAATGGGAAAGVAAGATTAATTAAVGAAAPVGGAATAAGAAASGGWVGVMAAGAAGLAAAAFTTAVSYGYRLYDDAATRDARMAGLLQGAVRSLDAGD